MSEGQFFQTEDLKFDPRLDAVTPIPELISGLIKKAKGDKRESNLKKAEILQKEWNGFVESVRTQGVHDALKVKTVSGKIVVIDGRHRLLAAREVGIEKVECVFPEVDYSREGHDEDDRRVMLDAETRRHLSKGAIAYRAVLIYPEVAIEAKERQKSGNKTEPCATVAQGQAFKNQKDLADYIGISRRLMTAACTLYKIFQEHPPLLKKHQPTVWTCENISKLLGQVGDSAERFEKTNKYEAEQPEKLSPEEKKKRARVILGADALKAQRQRLEKAEKIADGWDCLNEDARETLCGELAREVDILPDEYLQIYVKAASAKIKGKGERNA